VPEYKSAELRTLSMLGQRGVFGVTLDKLAAENNRIFALSADLKNTSGLDRFAANYPDRFVNVGIAEQNMVGIAAGLADSGYSVFASTFANFAALRACEFVRHFMGYMRSPVKLVGFAAGFAMEFFGNTHYGVEDVSAVRAISNLTIISPSDGIETAKAVTALVDYNAPAYLRLTGTANMPIVYKSDYDFRIGKAVTLKNGNDVLLVACGSMVANTLEVSKSLEDKGVSCSVVDMHTIKPLDTDTLDELIDTKLIVTVEEHNIIGGLGGAVAEYLSEKQNTPVMLKLGVSQGYKKAGGYKYMLEQNGLLPQQIADAVTLKLGGGGGGGVITN
jgi:transketolase